MALVAYIFEGDKNLFVIRTCNGVLSPNKPVQLWHLLQSHSAAVLGNEKKSGTSVNFPVCFFTSVVFFFFFLTWFSRSTAVAAGDPGLGVQCR